MTESLLTDEKPVERALRDILEPLDRRLAHLTAFLPLGLVTLVPSVFFGFWFFFDQSFRRSLVLAGGAVCVVVALYLAWEIVFARMARARFDRRFPAGTPERSAALHMLFEMESPSKAEDKLRVALGGSWPDRIVRRRPAEAPAAWTPAVVEEAAARPAIDPNPTPRSGGYYDYIPLEPRPGDSDGHAQRKG